MPAVTALQPVALRRNVVRVALLASPTTRKVRRTSPPAKPILPFGKTRMERMGELEAGREERDGPLEGFNRQSPSKA